MNLQNVHYITGIIKLNATRVAGYAIVEPNDGTGKAELVLIKDVRNYMTKHKCLIANATIDSFGQAHFKTKNDENSYVQLNTSGYVLGFNKKALKDLHKGNKTIDPQLNIEKPSFSYTVVDTGPDVTQVMNLNGYVKPMTTNLLIKYMNEGLIVSNAELQEGKLVLLNKSLSELLDNTDKSSNDTEVQKTVQARPQNNTVSRPINTARPLMPPGAQKTAQTTINQTQTSVKDITGVGQNTTSVIKNDTGIKNNVQQQNLQGTQTQPVKQVTPSTTQPVVRNNTSSIIDFTQATNEGLRFNSDFVSDYEGRTVTIKIELSDLSDTQFEMRTVNYINILVYSKDAQDKFEYRHSKIYFNLENLINLLSAADTRERLKGVNVTFYLNNRLVHCMDYRMFAREDCLVNLSYLINWEQLDLFIGTNKFRLVDVALPKMLSLLVLPNKVFDEQKNTYENLLTLQGHYYNFNYSAYCSYEKSNTLERTFGLTVIAHPKSMISEMKENGLDFAFDFPYGLPGGPKLTIDLTNTRIRFIPKNAITMLDTAQYIVKLPNTCKRIHKDAFELRPHGMMTYGRFTAYSFDDQELRMSHAHECGVKHVDKQELIPKVILVGNNIERIDANGKPYEEIAAGNRWFINAQNWNTLTSINKATVYMTDLPKVKKIVDLTPYIGEEGDSAILQDSWLGIGTWSDIDKGKIDLQLCQRSNEGTNNILISGTAKKVTLNLYTEKSQFNWNTIQYLFVEEGVQELTIQASTLRYRTGKTVKMGNTYTRIEHLILPNSLKSIKLQTTAKEHRYVSTVYIPEHSLLSKLNLKEEFQTNCLTPAIIQYKQDRQLNDKNMLSDFLGSDMTNIEMVHFDEATVKKNLELCGIKL